LESVDHKTRLIAISESVLVSFNTPLGRADRFRPAPPDLPALGSSRRTSQVRDTLPPCLGSNCSLGKERAGLSALVETRHYTHVQWAVNIPLSTFSFFLRSRWHGQRPGPQGLTALALHLPVLYTTCRGPSRAIRTRKKCLIGPATFPDRPLLSTFGGRAFSLPAPTRRLPDMPIPR